MSTTRRDHQMLPTCPRHASPIPDRAFACDRCGDDLRSALQAVAMTVADVPEPQLEYLAPTKLHPDGLWQLAAGEAGRAGSTPWDSPAARVGGLARDLVLTLTRQGVTGAGGVAKAAVTPLPWDERAQDALGCLEAAVQEAFQAVLAGRFGAADVDLGVTVTATAAYLIGQVDWIRHQPNARDILEPVVDAVREAQHVVDVRPERLMCGPCSTPALNPSGHPYICEAELRAIPGRAVVTCSNCGAEHDVAYRRGWLLERARDELATAPVLAAAVTRLGQPVTTDRVYQWAHRGRIKVQDRDARDRPRYRVGDVLDVLAEQAQRRADQARKSSEKAPA